jgi:catechol 2,3-dioxygenase-like lactoylglutathione lyase family enzyme
MAGRLVVNHVGHCVADLARARRLYEELLGCEFWRELTPPQYAERVAEL